MKLRFEEYLSAKMRKDIQLRVFPSGQPDDFLTERTDKRGGESEATTYKYDFPDNLVVMAVFESGGAIIDPEESANILIEVHIGPEAEESIAAAARAEAKKLAAEVGVTEQDFSGVSGLQFINH